MTEKHRYASYKLPTTISPLLARKYSNLNTEMLRLRPAIDLLPMTPLFMKSAEDWATELKQPGKSFWVCVAPNAKTDAMSLEEGRWIGLYALSGPLSVEEYNAFIPETAKVQLEKHETAWHVLRVMLKKGHRNFHALLSLDQAVNDFLVAETKRMFGHVLRNGGGPTTVSCRLQAESFYGSNMLKAALAAEGRILRHLTKVEFLEVAGRLDGVREELLSQEEYSKPVAAMYEVVRKFSN
jgi:hypothetical protein